jgi:hypothetical protein
MHYEESCDIHTTRYYSGDGIYKACVNGGGRRKIRGMVVKPERIKQIGRPKRR